jgi:hypothetical protein
MVEGAVLKHQDNNMLNRLSHAISSRYPITHSLLGITRALGALPSDVDSFDDQYAGDELTELFIDAADHRIAPELLLPSVFVFAIFIWPYFLILQMVEQ